VIVLIDACVLYPTVMREVALGAAKAGLFQARWSARILEEWTRATLKLGPEAHIMAQGEAASLSAKFPDAIVPVRQGLQERLWLPDPNDIHVFASAISGSADVILTMNAKDFPRDILAEEGVSRADPDGFLLGLAEANPEIMGEIVDGIVGQARRLSGEDWNTRSLMKKARLPRLGKRLAFNQGTL
jgi:hypothetical protein